MQLKKYLLVNEGAEHCASYETIQNFFLTRETSETSW